MSRRIEIELTSTRDDGSWTWRAAGAREPKGTLDGSILPAGASVGDVLRAEVEGFLDGLSVVSILPPRAPRREPERIELRTSRRDDAPLVTADVRRRSSSDRRRPDRGRRRDRDEAGGERPGRDRDRDRGRDRDDDRGRDRDRDRDDDRGRDRDRDRDRQSGRHDRGRGDRDRPGRGGDRPARPAAAIEAKPKPKRLRPARTHRMALLESLPNEQRPIAEQLLQGGIPAVRNAIDKQNESLRAEGKPEVGRDSLLKVAEDIRPKAMAALWRDRAEAAVASVDELDLRDLRSVVNAAADAGRDEEARNLATQLREALANRVEKEHSAWLAELSDTLRDGRVVRALRLSSRPPKAGAPIPTELTNQLADAAAAALTEETGQDRWATVLDALAYSPVRRRVIPQSLPHKLSPALRETVARLGSRLPEIAHIFDIEPDESAGRTGSGPGSRPPRGRGPRGRSGGESRPSGRGQSSPTRDSGGGSGSGSGTSGGSGGSGSSRRRKDRSSPPTPPEARSGSDTPPPPSESTTESQSSPPASASTPDSGASPASTEEPQPSSTESAAPTDAAAPPESPTEAGASPESQSSTESASRTDAGASSEPADESPSSTESAPSAGSSESAAEPQSSTESTEPADPAASPTATAEPQSSPESAPPPDAATSLEPVGEPESSSSAGSGGSPESAAEPQSSTEPEQSTESASEPQPAASDSEGETAPSSPEADAAAPEGAESNGDTRSPVIEAGTMPADDPAS